MLFLAGSLLGGLGFLVLFPPLTVADEPSHFYRAFAVTSGDLLAQSEAAQVGSRLPAALPRVAAEFRASWRLIFHPDWRADPGRLRATLDWRLAPNERLFVAYPTAAQFPAVVHLPQAAGIALGRLVGFGPVELVYLGRLGNLIVATLVLWRAIRLMPLGRWALALFALTPAAVSSRASLSADALTTAAAFLMVAAVAWLGWGPGTPTRRDRLRVVAAALLVCLTKLPYALLVLALLAVPRERLALRAERRLWTAALLALLLAIGLSTWVALEYGADLDSGVATDRDRQVRDALADPAPFLAMVARHYATHGGYHVQEAIGLWIGWADVSLPISLCRLYAGVLLALLLLAGSREAIVEWWQRLAVAGVVGLVLVVVAASQYAAWTAYGAEEIRGIQGRYFLPVAPLVALALHRRPSYRPHPVLLVLALAAFHALVTLVAWERVLARHWG